jgi:hypothetical protein
VAAEWQARVLREASSSFEMRTGMESDSLPSLVLELRSLGGSGFGTPRGFSFIQRRVI